MFTYFRYFGIFRFVSFRFASKIFHFASERKKRNQPFFLYFASLIFASVSLRFASQRNVGTPSHNLSDLMLESTVTLLLIFKNTITIHIEKYSLIKFRLNTSCCRYVPLEKLIPIWNFGKSFTYSVHGVG